MIRVGCLLSKDTLHLSTEAELAMLLELVEERVNSPKFEEMEPDERQALEDLEWTVGQLVKDHDSKARLWRIKAA